MTTTINKAKNTSDNITIFSYGVSQYLYSVYHVHYQKIKHVISVIIYKENCHYTKKIVFEIVLYKFKKGMVLMEL